MHSLHLSNTKIIYNKNDKALQITIRCFVDDMEMAVNKRNDIILELGNDRELNEANKYIESYLLDNFKLWINNSPKEIRFLGKEVENDIVYFYLEVNSVSSISNIKVKNTILLNEFDDQQNITRLIMNNKKKVFVLKGGSSSKEFNFK